MQRPPPHFIDESGLLEDRDEAGGRAEARRRIIPPDQRLGTGKLSGDYIYLGLIVQHELFAVECLAQLIFERKSTGHRLGHSLRIKQISIAADLGLFQRDFGVLEQGGGVSAVMRKQRDTNFRGDSKLLVIEVKRMADERVQRPLYLSSDLIFVPDIRQDDGKVIG